MMPPSTGDAPAATPGGVLSDRPGAARRWAIANRASLFVFAAAGVISTLRVLAWPPSLRQDQWFYTLSGLDLAHLRTPESLVKFATTTPKPLATLLGLIVSPLPPVRAFAAVAIVATGVLAAATFEYGRRVGGPLGAIIAVAALGLIPSLPPALYGGEIDLVSAALIVLALVSGPRTRVVLMVLLGLLRPLTWPLAGIAAYLAARGSLPRRLGLGAAGMVLPAALWLANDALLYGSLLTTYRVNDRINKTVVPVSAIEAVGRVARGVSDGTGLVLLVIGLLGLAVAIWRRSWRNDPFPAFVFLGYLVVLGVTWMRMKYNGRYALPFVVLWPLCAAHLASLVPAPKWLRASAMPAAVCTAVIFAAAALHMSHRRDDPNQLYTRLAVASVPTVNRGLVCGPVGVDVGDGKPLFVVLVFMAETGRPITDFRWYQAGMHTSLTRFVGPHAPKARSYLQSLKSNGWTTRPSPLGTVLTSPKCEPG